VLEYNLKKRIDKGLTFLRIYLYRLRTLPIDFSVIFRPSYFIGKSQKFILNPDLLTPEIRVKS